MKTISIILKNIRNLLPYLLLIAIYFFYVNLEARNDHKNKRDHIKEKFVPDKKSRIDEENLRISIPVIEYNQ